MVAESAEVIVAGRGAMGSVAVVPLRMRSVRFAGCPPGPNPFAIPDADAPLVHYSSAQHVVAWSPVAVA